MHTFRANTITVHNRENELSLLLGVPIEDTEEDTYTHTWTLLIPFVRERLLQWPSKTETGSMFFFVFFHTGILSRLMDATGINPGGCEAIYAANACESASFMCSGCTV